MAGPPSPYYTTPTNNPVPMAQFAPSAPVQGISQNDPRNNGAYVESVEPNSLASYQLGQLMRSDNPLVQYQARAAESAAAARGGGISSTQAIDASNQAMYGALQPVAAADAQRYGAVGDLNAQLLNQNQLARLQNQTSIQTANIAAGASRAATAERQHEFDTQDAERAQNREWQVADQNTAIQAGMRSQLFGNMESAIFSNPDFWSDPQGAMGMMTEYGTNMMDYLNNLFPEYLNNSGTAAGGSQP